MQRFTSRFIEQPHTWLITFAMEFKYSPHVHRLKFISSTSIQTLSQPPYKRVEQHIHDHGQAYTFRNNQEIERILYVPTYSHPPNHPHPTPKVFRRRPFWGCVGLDHGQSDGECAVMYSKSFEHTVYLYIDGDAEKRRCTVILQHT